MTQALFRQRKYSLALMFTITLIVALFTGFIDGGTFVGGMATILGLYGAANVGQKWAETQGKNNVAI